MKKIMFTLISLLLMGHLVMAEPTPVTTSSAASTENAIEYSELKNIPIHPFAAAQGPYGVGTSLFTWKMPNHSDEAYVGQIWYPTIANAKGKHASYLPEQLKSTELLLKYPILNSLSQITTDAICDFPILQGKAPYPTLLFSPGFGVFHTQDTFLFEYLASRGFIVAAIDHPGSSQFTEKPDGSFVYFSEEMKDPAWIEKPSHRTNLIRERSQQLSAALDALLQLNDQPESGFYQTVDKEKIGAFGHSIGGVTAIEACSMDQRFKAAANLDGGMMGNETNYTFHNQEVLVVSTDIEILLSGLSHEEYLATKQEVDGVMNQFMQGNDGKKYLVYYNDAGHFNYTDLPLFFCEPRTIPQVIGSVDSHAMLHSVATLLEDFFHGAFSPQGSKLENNMQKYFDAELIREAYQKE